MSDFKTNWENKMNKNINFKSFFDKFHINFSSKFRNTQRKYTIILAILFAIITYYIFLPPLNLRARETWLYLGSILTILVFLGGKSIKIYKILRYILLGMIALFLILNLIGLKIFQSKNYANIINPVTSDFSKDIEQLPINKIPTVDKDSSIKLGARKMGELLDLVSQFDIDETVYTQINYKDMPVRVTPLKYNGLIKYLFNMSQGIPGYLKIDIVTGNSELIKLKDKIKISKQDMFFRDIMRYTRIRYPFDIFYDANFEIDEEGRPFWIIPTYSPKIGFFDAQDVNGAILVNASTGEHKKYALKDIPQWVDRVFEASNIIEQLDWNGLYQGGFLNSLFSQKNVLKTTEGYNYLALNDDIYLYTGYTSVAADESNVGFIMCNLRTKETKFYPVSSAKEYSAMESAEGEVQEKRYKATFPLLLNINGKPIYFLSLKDSSGLVKQYAFIDAQNYQNVSVGNSVEQALANFKNDQSIVSGKNDNTKSEIKNIEGNIVDIKEVVIDGNSYYYFVLQDSPEIYVAKINLSEKLPFVKTGKIKFRYQKKNNINEVILIEELTVEH